MIVLFYSFTSLRIGACSFKKTLLRAYVRAVCEVLCECLLINWVKEFSLLQRAADEISPLCCHLRLEVKCREMAQTLEMAETKITPPTDSVEKNHTRVTNFQCSILQSAKVHLAHRCTWEGSGRGLNFPPPPKNTIFKWERKSKQQIQKISAQFNSKCWRVQELERGTQ